MFEISDKKKQQCKKKAQQRKKMLIKLGIYFLLFYISIAQQHVYHSKVLVDFLMRTNPELFQKELSEPNETPIKYADQIEFEKKLKSEVTLRVLSHSLMAASLDSSHLERIKQNLLFEPSFIRPEFLVSSSLKLLNETWHTYCAKSKGKCFEMCRMNSFKPAWCRMFHEFKHIYKRSIDSSVNRPFNLTNKILVNEIVNELIENNMKNSFIFLNSLAESSFAAASSRRKVCEPGFFNSLSNDCIDVDECNGTNRFKCDLNADCINTYGSFKCKCRKGYLGSGSVCFGGTFCSGKFCRLNGKCTFNRNRGGYKCRCMLDCMNGGVCVMSKFRYECKCPHNSTGLLCELTVDMFRLNKPKYAYMNLNETIELSKLVSLVEPIHKYFSLNKTQLNKYYSLLNKFYLIDSFRNKSVPNIKLFDYKETSSLIKPFHYENNFEYNDDYYYYY